MKTPGATAHPRRNLSLVRSPLGRGLVLTSCLGLLAGCSTIKPKPLTKAELETHTKAASAAAVADVPPLSASLTLDEAIARALKYNLNQRARLLEQSLAFNVWKAGNYDLLPSALASAGYRHRDKDLVTRSTDSVTGQPSLANPYISSERESMLYDLGFSWSVVDFTLGYYNARQNADRVLIAAEHRRKAMHALTREVTEAFWRMASAQSLLGDVRKTIADAEAAVADSAKESSENLRSPVESLRFQRQLLENIRLLSNIERDFTTARSTLANLVNLPLSQEFTVAEPQVPADVLILEIPVDRLERLALRQNAALREEIYNERIALAEVRKTIAGMFPDLSFNYNLRHSTDSYLINDSWREAGILLSQNLGGLLSAPARKRLADGGVELAKQRKVAAHMALLAQVHIARLELAAQHRQLVLSERIWTIDRGIRDQAANREAAQTEGALGRVAAETAAIVSMLRRYQALADYQTASGALQSTLGLEINLKSVGDMSLEDLTAAVSAWQKSWQAGELPDESAPVDLATAP